ncbi:hypothetical protein GCM10022197_28770 [Microlunatus spumicola]|uniref:Tryptophan-associated transmembrane protein (Trp_oprn_chp) n=1 Tax=Microlunatus spumicola TaxID=81499 RepID=A0ABP6XPY1_9ACTN
MDRLTALRAPLAVVALVVLTVVAAARVVLGLSEVVTVGGSRAVAAARLAPNAGDAALTVLVGVLVAACFLGPVVPARRRLAVWGTVLTVVSLAATLVALGLTDLTVAGWNLVWSLPDLAVPVVVGLALLALARPEPGRQEQQALTQDAAGPAPEPEPEPDPDLQPSWTEDTAAGAVWSRAGDAARGAPAQGWGTSGGAGWPPSVPPELPAGRAEDQAPTDRT